MKFLNDLHDIDVEDKYTLEEGSKMGTISRRASINDLVPYANKCITNKRVLIRLDLNVPRNKNTGNITDDTRIKESLPTINLIIKHGGLPILMSHLGRPDGVVKENLRLNAVGVRLQELLGPNANVIKLDDCIGPEVEKAAREMQQDQVLLLENLRFYPEEEANDPVFSENLAKLADYCVDDAFGTSHRGHASTKGVKLLLPAVAGLLMQKELDNLSETLQKTTGDYIALIGGSKISTKINVINSLSEYVNKIIIGGGLVYTFLKSAGHEIGTSIYEEDQVANAGKIWNNLLKNNIELYMPQDFIAADKIDNPAIIRTVDYNMIPKDLMGLDSGPKSMELFKNLILGAEKIIWNGPFGVLESKFFRHGTVGIAKAVAQSKAKVYAGGGETLLGIKYAGEEYASIKYADDNHTSIKYADDKYADDKRPDIKHASIEDQIYFMSTGGGAMLEFIETKGELPGVMALYEISRLSEILQKLAR